MALIQCCHLQLSPCIYGHRHKFSFFQMPLEPFHRLFEFGQGQRGPMIPYCPGAP
ncbi:unnamed protein product, partial [Staurois parvus]